MDCIQPTQTLRVVIGMFIHIVVINVLSNIGEQLLADLICLLIEDDNIDGHVVFKQELTDRINRNSQRLVFRITIDAR